MAEVKTVQLTDGNGNPVAPFIPASSVYYIYGEPSDRRMVNMETKLGSMDVDRINDMYNETVRDMEELSASSIQKIEDERDSYENDINALSAMMKTLYDKQFPVVINTTITGRENRKNNFTYDYSYMISGGIENDLYSSTLVVKNDKSQRETTIFSNKVGQSGFTEVSGVTINNSVDTFYLTTQRRSDNKTISKTEEMCKWMYGPYGETFDEYVNFVGKMEKQLSKSLTNLNIITTQYEQYIWIGVPDVFEITKITSQGLDVSYNKITVDDTQYNWYRSSEPLASTTWSLSIITKKV